MPKKSYVSLIFVKYPKTQEKVRGETELHSHKYRIIPAYFERPFPNDRREKL